MPECFRQARPCAWRGQGVSGIQIHRRQISGFPPCRTQASVGLAARMSEARGNDNTAPRLSSSAGRQLVDGPSKNIRLPSKEIGLAVKTLG